jgi:hypothetical protein
MEKSFAVIDTLGIASNPEIMSQLEPGKHSITIGR